LLDTPWLLSIFGQLWDSNASQHADNRQLSRWAGDQCCDRSIDHGTLGLVQPSRADIEALAFGHWQPIQRLKPVEGKANRHIKAIGWKPDQHSPAEGRKPVQLL
jgi:hypothetical protein